MRWLVNFFLDGFMLVFFGSVVQGQATDPRLSPVQAIPVQVTVNKMTTLIFPSAIRSGIRVSRDILVQRVKGVDNALELKALRRQFVPTNLAVYAVDGKLYAFEIQYADDPPVLSFVIGGGLAKEAELLERCPPAFHHSHSEQGVRLDLTGVYLADNLMWMVIQVTNGSPIPYTVEHFRLYSEARKTFKRHATQQLPIKPVYEDEPLSIEAAGTKTFVLAVPMFTLDRNRRLVMEMQEKGQGRLIRLRLKGGVLLKSISK